ncbi:hypothetical protein ACFL5G_03740 [Candidatus Margulisiibacteriota bacterium]
MSELEVKHKLPEVKIEKAEPSVAPKVQEKSSEEQLRFALELNPAIKALGTEKVKQIVAEVLKRKTDITSKKTLSNVLNEVCAQLGVQKNIAVEKSEWRAVKKILKVAEDDVEVPKAVAEAYKKKTDEILKSKITIVTVDINNPGISCPDDAAGVDPDAQPITVTTDPTKPDQVIKVTGDRDVYTDDDLRDCLKKYAIEDVTKKEISDHVVSVVRKLIASGDFTWENVQKLVDGDEITVTIDGKPETLKLEDDDKKVFAKVFKPTSVWSPGWTEVAFDTIFGDVEDHGDNKADGTTFVNSLDEFYEMALAVDSFNSNEKMRDFLGYEKKYQCYKKYFPKEQEKMAEYGELYVNQHADKAVIKDIDGDGLDKEDYALCYARAILWMKQENRAQVIVLDKATGEYKIDYAKANKLLGIEVKKADDPEDPENKKTEDEYILDPALGIDVKVTKEDIKEEDPNGSYKKEDIIQKILARKIRQEIFPGTTDFTEQDLIDYFNGRADVKDVKIDGVEASKVYARYVWLVLADKVFDKKLGDMQPDIVAALKTKETQQAQQQKEVVNFNMYAWKVNNGDARLRNEDGSSKPGKIPATEQVFVELGDNDEPKIYEGTKGGEYGESMYKVKRANGDIVFTYSGNFNYDPNATEPEVDLTQGPDNGDQIPPAPPAQAPNAEANLLAYESIESATESEVKVLWEAYKALDASKKISSAAWKYQAWAAKNPNTELGKEISATLST